MKKTLNLLVIVLLFAIVSCGGDKPKKKTPAAKPAAKTEVKQEVKKETPKKQEEVTGANAPASKRIDLKNRGIGPVTSVKLDAEINQEMAKKGAEIFKKMCTACHKPTKRFIGPSPKDILKRRSPEWVMNMILNPQEMIKKDPLAKELLVEFNGSPMANQNLTEEEARAVLEYYRTLK